MRLDTQLNSQQVYRSAGQQVSRSIGQQVDRSASRQVSRSTGRQVSRSTVSKSTGQQVDRSAGQQVSRSTGRQVNRSTGQQGDRSAGRQVNRSAGRQDDRSTGQQVDMSAGRQVDRSAGQQVSRSTGQQDDRSTEIVSPGNVNTTDNLVTRFPRDQNHPPSHAYIKAKLSMSHLPEKAHFCLDPLPTLCDSEILQFRCREWDENTRQIVEKIPTFTVCKSSLYRQRNTELHRQPATRQNIDLQTEWGETLTGYNDQNDAGRKRKTRKLKYRNIDNRLTQLKDRLQQGQINVYHYTNAVSHLLKLG
ncbi:Hypothetical predicted protein [Mytilus galloprovincialis]|uniref:Uncharacterized protein n=1 Tax=Mytilus galloprovincialis TaxID=29158 RepID=A0A8B6H7P3_MYTGA|nr:Hypothetical predicted protein [Mytilus galloprovincialis]